jgi:hypothetical protein
MKHGKLDYFNRRKRSVNVDGSISIAVPLQMRERGYTAPLSKLSARWLSRI